MGWSKQIVVQFRACEHVGYGPGDVDLSIGMPAHGDAEADSRNKQTALQWRNDRLCVLWLTLVFCVHEQLLLQQRGCGQSLQSLNLSQCKRLTHRALNLPHQVRLQVNKLTVTCVAVIVFPSSNGGRPLAAARIRISWQ